VMEEETHSVPGIERQQNSQVLSHTPNARGRDNSEPKKHDRTEEGGDAGGPPRLHHEQYDENENRERHHIGVERRGDDFQPLDRRKNRQRRRNDGVTIEKRTADNTEKNHDATSAHQRT